MIVFCRNKLKFSLSQPLHEQCQNTEFLLRKSPYSVQMRKNTNQKNSVFGQFLRSKLCGL